MKAGFDVAGVSADALGAEVISALVGYSALMRDAVQFDFATAAQLAPVEGKHYSACSDRTPVDFFGNAATLTVVAFAPGEGTGNHNDVSLEAIEDFDGLDPVESWLPRSKQGTDTEFFLPLVSAWVGEPRIMHRYAGSLTLVGLGEDGRSLKAIKSLGQPRTELETTVHSGAPARPSATMTTGYEIAERVGDPHAVANSTVSIVQVGAFIAQTERQAATKPTLFRYLEHCLR